MGNVLLSNGWIGNNEGTFFIYHPSSDTRTPITTKTIKILVDYYTLTGSLSTNEAVEKF